MNDRFIKVTRYMCGKTVDTYFAGKVESIEIKIKTTYKSFTGIREESWNLKRRKDEVADFYTDCPNHECTEGYIDFRDEVNNLYRSMGEITKGEKVCKGKVAPDHPNQRCDTTIEYEIKITYSK